MKTIHFRNEFGEPETMKIAADGITWNELTESWHVFSKYSLAHAQCRTISAAKDFQKTTIKSWEDENGKLHIERIEHRAIGKGGYNRKKNHVLNRIEKQWLRKSEIEYFNKLRKKQKHRRKANGI